MSISKVFYSLLGDKSVSFSEAEFQEDYVIFRGRLRANLKKCSCCGSVDVRTKETKERTFRMLNLGSKRTYLKIDSYKIHCNRCDVVGWLQLPFVVGKLPMTKSFIRYITQLISMSTLICVAIFLGIQWKTVKNIDKIHLAKRAKQFSFKKLRYISIDEVSIKKGHKYMTIFTDISTGQIIHAVEGRTEEHLRPFLRLLAKKARRLKGIGIDMSGTYAKSIGIHLSHVAIIYDRFHVTQLLNKAVDKLRKSEFEKCRKNGIDIAKGQRYLLLRNFIDLDDKQRDSLQELLSINQPLAIAHALKEQFRLFWEQNTRSEGLGFLCRWVGAAFDSGIAQLKQVASTLMRHYRGLVSYFVHGIDNGKAEGINNKIKVLKRKAYGYRDQEYFKLKLYNIHRKEYELIG